MKSLLPVLWALIAAVGNALFAMGQKQSAAAHNDMAFVTASAAIAVMLAFVSAAVVGSPAYATMLREQFPSVAISGLSLFLTYLGFNILYGRYGASYYVLYAVLSILTTAVIVGALWLKEPLNLYHKVAVMFAIAAVVLFSAGQHKIR